MPEFFRLQHFRQCEVLGCLVVDASGVYYEVLSHVLELNVPYFSATVVESPPKQIVQLVGVLQHHAVANTVNVVLDLIVTEQGLDVHTEARGRRASEGEVDDGGGGSTQAPLYKGIWPDTTRYISKRTSTERRLTWPDTTRGRDEGQGKLECYYIYMSGRTP